MALESAYQIYCFGSNPRDCSCRAMYTTHSPVPQLGSIQLGPELQKLSGKCANKLFTADSVVVTSPAFSLLNSAQSNASNPDCVNLRQVIDIWWLISSATNRLIIKSRLVSVSTSSKLTPQWTSQSSNNWSSTCPIKSSISLCCACVNMTNSGNIMLMVKARFFSSISGSTKAFLPGAEPSVLSAGLPNFPARWSLSVAVLSLLSSTPFNKSAADCTPESSNKLMRRYPSRTDPACQSATMSSQVTLSGLNSPLRNMGMRLCSFLPSVSIFLPLVRLRIISYFIELARKGLAS